MATAKSLTPTELQQVLAYIAENSFAQRNRLMLMCTVAAGMRVSEVSGLLIGDVRNADGTIRSEVFLSAERVKHNHARTVYINTRLQQELAEYVAERKWHDNSQPLFSTNWHSPNSVDKYYCQNLNGRNANAKSQIHS